MVKNVARLSAVLLLLASACSSSNNKPLLIEFSADSSTVEFSNVQPAGLLQLKELSAADPSLYDLITVSQIPLENDTSLKEEVIDGTIAVTDSNVVFKPASPFIKGKTYLVITHLNADFGNMEKLLKNEMSPSVKAHQQLLHR